MLLTLFMCMCVYVCVCLMIVYSHASTQTHDHMHPLKHIITYTRRTKSKAFQNQFNLEAG
jgi:hypothetical protein